MKKFISILFFLTLMASAQAIVSGSTIAMQGVLKDNSNNAIENVENIPASIIIYRFATETTTATIKSVNASLKTDDFGVFSYVVELSATDVSNISHYQSYMKIEAQSVVIFDQKLRSVPYSIYAKNGMPTGTVMPIMSEDLPQGWLWCNGSSIPNDIFHQNLRQIVGNNTPDFRGYFLRGTGTSNRFSRSWAGPSLLEKQGSTTEQHNHGVNIQTNETGSHYHGLPRDYGGWSQRDRYHLTTSGGSDEGISDEVTVRSGDAGSHRHNVSGNTSWAGGYSLLGSDSEQEGPASDWGMRPKNVGVNWIIKI